jgi:release factor glutamine methyltransferase
MNAAVLSRDQVNSSGTLPLGALLEELAVILHKPHIEHPHAEARDIVAAIAGEGRFWPLANKSVVAGQHMIDHARHAAARRARGEPFAYAVGRAAFRHLTLKVDARVLIPRQETELLVQAVLDELDGAGGVAADIGTGSGAIALALAQEGSLDRIIAVDVSRDALDIAEENERALRSQLRGRVEFRAGSLLDPVREQKLRAVVSNPPYIARAEMPELPRSVRDWEPPLALLSGVDGMTALAALIRGAPAVLERNGLLALEIDSRRAQLTSRMAAETGEYTNIRIRDDLAGRPRILTARRR